MKVEYTFHGSNYSDARSMFRAISSALEKIIKEAERMVAQELGKDATRIAPYQTGQLSRSLRIYDEGNGFVVEFGANLKYTRKVYYVTAKSGALKWTETAFNTHSKKLNLLYEKKLSEL